MTLAVHDRGRTVSLSSPALWRAALVALPLLAGAAAFALGQPQRLLAADPELARLLRGMAAIKAGIALIALALAWWRLGRPTAPALALAYVAAVATMAGVSVSIWQLTALGVTSVLFHVALLVAAFAAMHDDGALLRAALRKGKAGR